MEKYPTVGWVNVRIQRQLARAARYFRRELRSDANLPFLALYRRFCVARNFLCLIAFQLRRAVAGLLLGLLLAGPTLAQPGWLRAFGPAEGLRQPFIYALAQDREGFLWLGTAEGLVRYDGSAFVTFTTKDGLRDDFVTGLYADPRTGQLWAKHYAGGFSVRPQPGDRFSGFGRDAGG